MSRYQNVGIYYVLDIYFKIHLLFVYLKLIYYICNIKNVLKKLKLFQVLYFVNTLVFTLIILNFKN